MQRKSSGNSSGIEIFPTEEKFNKSDETATASLFDPQLIENVHILKV
jgi:hypothetical protein